MHSILKEELKIRFLKTQKTIDNVDIKIGEPVETPNCQMNIYNMGKNAFKVVVSPATQILEKIHSDNIFNLAIDLQFEQARVAGIWFPKCSTSEMSFNNDEPVIDDLWDICENPQKFVSEYLSNHISMFETILTQEFPERSLFDIVIGKKVLYTQLKI